MKYPRLPENVDLRKKLMASDIADIQKAYEDALPFPTQSEVMKKRKMGIEVQSKTQWINEIMELYGVSYHTVYYWTNTEYREYKMEQNAKAHSKADLEDYEKHRAIEIKRRVERWSRNSELREWHYQTSARNEKRAVRHTVMGKPLEKRKTND